MKDKRIIIFMLLVFLCSCDQPGVTTPSPAPAEVVAMSLEATPVPVTSDFVAQVRSSHQVEIMARVSGFLEQITYREGELEIGRASCRERV